MDALKLLLAAMLLVSPHVAAQAIPDASEPGSIVNSLQDEAYPVAENESGQDISSEEIGLDILVDIRDARFDLFGVLLGGGAAETTINLEADLAIRAVNTSRLEQALDQYNDDANASASQLTGIDLSRPAVTADAIRTIGGGVLLEAFQAYQEQAARAYLADTLPHVTILNLAFDWQNTRPIQGAEDPDTEIREPPLVLQVTGQMQFLDRFSLLGLIGDASDDAEPKTPQEQLRQRLQENQTLPLVQRDAFQTLGVAQLVSLELPPGWRLNLTVQLPQGYTISQATDALEVDEDRQTASYRLDGTGQQELRTTSGVVKLSDRSLVTTTVAAIAVGVGLLLRLPTEFAALRLRGP